MGTIDIAVILLLLVVVATAIVSCIVVSGNRRKALSRLDEAKIKTIEEKQTRELEQEAAPIFEEEERPQDEIEYRRLEEESRSAEEALRRIEEEPRRLEEEEHREVKQAGSKTEEGHRKPEELPEIEEEVRHKEEPQPKAQEEVHLKAEALDNRLAPVKRGGRPRTSTEEQEKQTTQETKHRLPKPEFVCWKKERQWIVGVEVPEDFLELPGLQVLQNGSPLPQDESREACWCPEKVYDKVVVRCVEGEDVKETEVAHGQEGYLLFKLSGQNQNEGRRVKSPSLGWHAVMTPENWDRDEALSGPPPVAPESVSLNGYDAHFFINERDSDKKIAFLKPTGESVIIESKASRFELVGLRLNDASEDIGPLFGKRSPRIRGSHGNVWKDVGTIVVGEEGSGKGRWRKAFGPVPEKREQDLPPEVAVRKDGWYFLRFYDRNDDFIESLDFRVASALRDIKILEPSPFPSDGEHESARIELHHESGCAIQPADDLARNIQIEEKNNRTTLIIPPDPIYDETLWLVGSTSAPKVQVTLLVERLWWVIGKENSPPSEWRDELLTLTSDSFTATTNQALWLRLPRRRWANRVLVGFERSRARPYPVKVTEREIAIPLREFGDCQEMGEQDRKHFLTIWIERDKESIEGSVAIVPASMGPILCIGWGRKKRAIATVVLREGDGAIKVNGRVADDYFARTPRRARQFLRRLVQLPDISNLLSQLDVSIEVRGSSPNTVQQVKASTHGLAHALIKYDSLLNPLLTQAGFGGVEVKVTEKFGVQTGRRSDESNRTGT